MSKVLPRAFYLRSDVATIARELLGMVLVTRMSGTRTAGVITETEAYAGRTDRASHAFAGKRTTRNEPMYTEGGHSYVYLCYGIHHLFNVVTNLENEPHAVLVRGISPLEGMNTMLLRRGGSKLTTSGPGTLSVALGIHTLHSGSDLLTGPIRIEDHGIRIPEGAVLKGPRIGVDYAGADAQLPYRFRVAPSHLSFAGST